MASHPVLSGLLTAAGVPTALPHPLLSDGETSREMLLRYQQHRSNLIRTYQQCYERGECIPPALTDAILAMAADKVLSPEGSASSHAASTLVNTTTAPHHRSTISSRSATPGNVTSPSSGAVGSSQKGKEAPVTSTQEHIDMTTSAIANGKDYSNGGAPASPSSSIIVSKISIKALLDSAYAARRAGDRGGEIRALLAYVDAGKAGEVPFDHSTGFRVFRQVGDAYAALNDIQSAEHFYFDWYLTADKSGQNEEASRALCQIGKLHQSTGDLQVAEEWFRKAQIRLSSGRTE